MKGTITGGITPSDELVSTDINFHCRARFYFMGIGDSGVNDYCTEPSFSEMKLSNEDKEKWNRYVMYICNEICTHVQKCATIDTQYASCSISGTVHFSIVNGKIGAWQSFTFSSGASEKVRDEMFSKIRIYFAKCCL